MGVCDLSTQKILVVPPDKYMLCVHNFNFKSDHLPPKSNVQVQNIQSHIHEIMDVSMRLTVHRMYSSSISHFFAYLPQVGPPDQDMRAAWCRESRVEGSWGTVNLSQHTVLKVEGRIVPGMLHQVNLGRVSNYLIMFDLCMSFQGITYQ